MTELLSLSEDIQKLIIRAKHFPMPSLEGYALAYMFLRKAISPKSAITMENEKQETIEKLVRQGQIKKTRKGLLFLSDEGTIVAKGILKIHPQLKNSK